MPSTQPVLPRVQPIRPRILVQSFGGGLLLMALFTMMWAGIAQGGLQGADHYIQLVTSSIISLLFIVYGIRLLLLAKRFPKFTSPEHQVMAKQMIKSFGITFGAEGLAIAAVGAVLGLTHHEQFILPAMALIVGLHFYPMARVFDRTIDYYLATWTCLIALAAIFMTFYNSRPETFIVVFLGIGVSLATISYGLYMLRTARRLNLYKPLHSDHKE
jgi:hypothetical protein